MNVAMAAVAGARGTKLKDQWAKDEPLPIADGGYERSFQQERGASYNLSALYSCSPLALGETLGTGTLRTLPTDTAELAVLTNNLRAGKKAAVAVTLLDFIVFGALLVFGCG